MVQGCLRRLEVRGCPAVVQGKTEGGESIGPPASCALSLGGQLPARSDTFGCDLVDSWEEGFPEELGVKSEQHEVLGVRQTLAAERESETGIRGPEEGGIMPHEHLGHAPRR